jgi:hypothetical protein
VREKSRKTSQTCFLVRAWPFSLQVQLVLRRPG